MIHIKLYLFNFLLLLMTVPWFFYNDATGTIIGIPNWAFYSLLVTFFYAAITCILIKKYWFIGNYKEDLDK